MRQHLVGLEGVRSAAKPFAVLAILSLTATASPLAPTPVAAQTIERACAPSERSASRRLCGCIQDVADLTLSKRDQQLAASFFRDPHRAQEIRQSDRRSHEAFWDRYKEFGASAEKFCG